MQGNFYIQVFVTVTAERSAIDIKNVIHTADGRFVIIYNRRCFFTEMFLPKPGMGGFPDAGVTGKKNTTLAESNGRSVENKTIVSEKLA